MVHILRATEQELQRNLRTTRSGTAGDRRGLLAACAFLVAGAGLLQAQNTTASLIGGSLSGYLYWPADRSVRPILGYPGAAYAGTAVLSNMEFASVSPDGRWAVMVKNGRTRILRDFQDSGEMDGLLQAPDRVIWSGDRKTAVLYSATANAMQKVRLVDGGPQAEPVNDVSNLGSITTLALAPGGDRIAVGTPEGVYLFTAGQQPVRLAAMENPASAVFADGGASLYILNKAAQPSVHHFYGETLSGQSSVSIASISASDSIASEDGVTTDPVSIALSGNERYLLVADRARQSLQIYEKSSMRFTSSLPLDYSPAALELLTIGATFLVRPDGSGANLSIVLAKDLPSVYFLPPPGPDL